MSLSYCEHCTESSATQCQFERCSSFTAATLVGSPQDTETSARTSIAAGALLGGEGGGRYTGMWAAPGAAAAAESIGESD